MPPDILSGLSENEAASRLRAAGPNELPRPVRRTILAIAFEVCREPMLQLLLVASGIYLILGSLGEALVLAASAGVTVAIAIVQEARTERVLDALNDLASPNALVVRGGARKHIPARDVVRGDIVLLAEGDRVPADSLLVEAHDLEADESLLTGESVAVRKRAAQGERGPARPGGDDLPHVFAGTVIVRGQGVAEIVATGASSEIGRIGKAIGSIDQAPTPLRAQTRRIVSVFGAIAIGFCILATLLYGLTRGSWLEAILAGVTLAMSMLPEEFPLVLSIFLVMGAWRIAQSRVLARRSATIEALGAATVLCTDKTGTLTFNRMAITELRADDIVWRAGDATLPEQLHALLEFGILASEADPSDPMEKAFHDLGRAHLASTEHLHGDWLLAHEYGLAPDLLAMSHVWKATGRDDHVIAAKGAPEAVADLCHMGAAALATLHRDVERMAEGGMRVLAVAAASFAGSAWPGSQHDFPFAFLGLVGLTDPLRPAVPAAIRECRDAGIKVAMITGDHAATARAIAVQAGIDPAGLLMGSEMEAMADDELRRRVGTTTIFARIMPEQKLRIVEALKANGEIVAMTGDGVNDAPSLKAAHIGIAMGKRGTDVARAAASMVLLDDDFAAIVTAVRLGRRIYDNLRKAMTYILAVHVPIAGLALLPLVFGWPLIFAPVHIAFLELVIDPVCSIVFEAEGEEPDIMRRPPRNSAAALFSRRLVAWGIFQGACVLAVTAGLYVAALHLDVAEAEARTITFATLILCNLALVLLDRSAATSLAAALRRPNPALWKIAAAALGALAVTIGVEPVRGLFHFALLTPWEIAVSLGAAVTLLVSLEALRAAASGVSLRIHGTAA